MAHEMMIPLLPCRDIDESLSFYEALGFERTYRQVRPNPYAAVARDDFHVHLFGIDGFDPEQSYGNVLVAVPDVDELYTAFAAGLRAAYGRLPSAGIPRILRPRKRFGTVRGFSVVDPGGNWLRISRRGDTEEAANAAARTTTGLARVVENAARAGDAQGDHAGAARLLDNGLARFADAPPPDRVRALAYRAELAVRLADQAGADESLTEARSLAAGLTAAEQATVADDLDHAAEVVASLA
ncbi:MAG TPA: VOC family protein [Acidimicrobiales bacterium]|nr:VOC family protein [Acidimicrobiales bacterium]